MAKKTIIIELEFDEVEEDDYTYLEFSSMRLGNNTTASQEDRESLAEGWAQSDWYSVGLCNSLINVIADGDEVLLKDIKAY